MHSPEEHRGSFGEGVGSLEGAGGLLDSPEMLQGILEMQEDIPAAGVGSPEVDSLAAVEGSPVAGVPAVVADSLAVVADSLAAVADSLVVVVVGILEQPEDNPVAAAGAEESQEHPGAGIRAEAEHIPAGDPEGSPVEGVPCGLVVAAGLADRNWSQHRRTVWLPVAGATCPPCAHADGWFQGRQTGGRPHPLAADLGSG